MATTTTRRRRGRPPRHPAFDRDDHYEKRREAMVQTAIRIFNRHGYHETSMEAIATALGWGFSHFGRFAQLYRERFGERPSETLRR